MMITSKDQNMPKTQMETNRNVFNLIPYNENNYHVLLLIIWMNSLIRIKQKHSQPMPNLTS